MKKNKLIPTSLLGFSLAFGLITFAKAPEKANPTSAAAAVFRIGTHDLLSNATCSGSPYTGTATLETKSTEYVLTLDGFNNNNTVFTAGSLSAALIIYNTDIDVTIKVKGTCTLNNNSSTETSYGALISTTAAKTIKIVGEGSNAKLKIGSPSVSGGESDAFCCIAGSGIVNNVSITNCAVEATSGVSQDSYAFELGNSALSVGAGATVTATSNGINTTDTSNYHYAVGIKCGSYSQTAGTVKATAGTVNKKGSSIGLRAANGNVTIQNGRLEAKGSNSDKFSTFGINALKGSVILNSGAEVVAEAGSILASDKESGARAYGIQLGTPSGNQVSIGANANYLYSISKHSENIIGWGINTNINASFAGFASDSDIFSDENRSTVASGTHTYIEKKQVLFQRVQYTATAASAVNYDGVAHTSMSASVTYPTSATIQYRKQGESSWGNSAPKFTDANESGYIVEYKISASKFVPVTGQVTFIIHKVASSVTVAPTLVSELTYNGTAQSLINAGTASGGSLVYSVDGGDYGSTATAINAGTHSVSYKVVGDDNHNDTTPVELGSVTIGKVNATVTKAPKVVSAFEADGKSHNLVAQGTVEGGSFVYSVNGGEFKPGIPSATNEGTYSISYKVIGDDNHFGIDEPVSIGSVVISKPVEPISPSKKGLSAGAVVGIVLGSLVFVLGAAYLLLFFLLNKWIKVGDKAVRVMRFALGSKDGKERYLSFKFKFEYREKHEVFSTKDEALK